MTEAELDRVVQSKVRAVKSRSWDELAWALVCGASGVIGSRPGMSQELC